MNPLEAILFLAVIGVGCGVLFFSWGWVEGSWRRVSSRHVSCPFLRLQVDDGSPGGGTVLSPLRECRAECRGVEGIGEAGMILDEVRRRVAAVQKSGEEHDGLPWPHEMEDELHRDVLRAIANGECENPAEAARLALETCEMDFIRMYE